MLARLHVRNYAIISELDVQFGDGLTIITGETGAGKSILIGALSMVLGKRADSSVLHNSEEKCVVEAFFKMDGYNLKDFFDQNDLDLEPVTILRREINAQGKSRAFINDTPVNLAQLKELADGLIDIHSQHEVLTLKTADFRARFLDACSDGGKQFQIYSANYSRWNELKRRVEEMKEALSASASNEDYLRFQLNELEELKLSEGELTSAQERLTMLENAEEIRLTISNLTEAFAGEVSVLDALRAIELQTTQLSRKLSIAKEWSERIRSSMIELEDVATEIDQYTDKLSEDPEELLELQQRVDEIQRIMNKHRKLSDSELIEYLIELRAALDAINNSDEQLMLLSGELELTRTQLEKEASVLSQLRKESAKQISPKITNELHALGMPEAVFSINISKGDLGLLGQDKIEMAFTSNKGQQPQDVGKVASGGELSRLMLSVKSEIANTTKLPAIIFDEIDTGVSGEVANKVGQKIKSLSSHLQVLCITHLPQIASKANHHLFVYKAEEEGRTVTRIRELDKSDRIIEIAKMLSTANPTEAALTHAKNLVNEN